MSPADLALAGVYGGLFLAAVSVVAVMVQRACFSDWRGSTTVVGTALIGICWTLALGQLLGAVGWFRAVPLTIAALLGAVASVAALRGRRLGGANLGSDKAAVAQVDPEPSDRSSPVLLVGTTVLVLVVAAIWVARTIITLRRGIYDPDSVGFHIPFAAIFAQTGFADPTGFVFPETPIQFFPANDELLSAVGLVLTKSIAFAVLKNLLLGGLVLVAAHSLGKAFKAGTIAVAAGAIGLGVPVVAFSQPGEAVNDTLPLVALVGGLAFLAHARDRTAPYVLTLACAGLSYGVKYSTIVPALAVGGLALCLLWARAPAHRLRTAVLGVAASLLVGGSWYLRNALAFDNPIPPAGLSIGPFELREIGSRLARNSYSVAWYLVRGRDLGDFWDGLWLGLGPAVPIVLALIVYGVAANAGRRDGMRLGLAVVTASTLVGYVVSPNTAFGPVGDPLIGFTINLHYAMPPLMFGLLAGAIALARWRWNWIVPVAGLGVVSTGVNAYRRGVVAWAPELGGPGFAVLAAVAVVAGAVTWLAVVPRRPRVVKWARPAAMATALAAVVGMALVATRYDRRDRTDVVQRWAADVAPTRIGGWVPPAALFYGPGARNRVETVFRNLPNDGGSALFGSCPMWMAAIERQGAPYIAMPSGTPNQNWTRADPAFQLVVESAPSDFYKMAVYRVVGRPDPRCPRAR